MAVDVPETFIARNKTQPVYPPPRPPIQVNHMSNVAMPQVAKPPINNGGVSLDLEPFDSPTYTHYKNSPSLDSSNEFIKKSSSIKGPSSLGSTCESIGFDSMSYRTKSRGSLSTRSSSSSGEIGPPEYDLGPHRELPVDVPDSFVEIIKGPPIYPPPKPQIVKEMIKKKGSNSSQESIELKQRPQPQAPTRNEVFIFHHSFFWFFNLIICFLFIFLNTFLFVFFILSYERSFN